MQVVDFMKIQKHHLIQQIVKNVQIYIIKFMKVVYINVLMMLIKLGVKNFIYEILLYVKDVILLIILELIIKVDMLVFI